MRLGIHTFTSGGLERAALTAAELGANTFQIFSSSPRMWRASLPDPAAGFAAPSAMNAAASKNKVACMAAVYCVHLLRNTSLVSGAMRNHIVISYRC